MKTFICREDLRVDLMEYAVCAGQPRWLARHKALEVVDNIPEGIVRCRNCEKFDVCEFGLGADGFCSEGARRNT